MRSIRAAVGIPTFQESDSIENVVKQVDAGLARLFDPADCVIVNVDSDSPDRTSEIFLNTPTLCGKESIVITEQPRGKGRNVLRFFERCAELPVAALAIVDGDLRSITPEWIEALLTPVLQGEADYVTPLYLRHRFDGSMTNHFAYPMMSGYFGSGLRQPVGGEFAFSAALIERILKQPVEEAILGYGIDIFLSMHAVGGGFKLAQARLGRKLHKPSFPKWNLIQPQAVAGAIATMRLYPIRVAGHDFQSAPDSIDDWPEYRFYDESQALLAEARARARDLTPVYRSWLGEKPGEKPGEKLGEDLFSAFEEGGPALSAEAWTDLLAACVAHSVWIDPRATARSVADHLMPALFIRIITSWNETWKRPIEEFNAEINLQAKLLREKLLARAREAEVANASAQGVNPSSP
ncbi:MAG: glycosyltransferase family 2 protein [Blastocatellales bacterium]